jgi:hypothetical protein
MSRLWTIDALAAGIVANDNAVAVDGRRAIGAAFAAFAHHGTFGARSTARAFAADTARPGVDALRGGGTAQAGIERDELANTLFTAAPEVARGNDRALVVKRAGFGAAFSAAALVSGKAFDDRLKAEPIDARVRDARVVMFLASTVAMCLANAAAQAVNACLAFGAPLRALLTAGVTRTGDDRRHHDRYHGPHHPASR